MEPYADEEIERVMPKSLFYADSLIKQIVGDTKVTSAREFFKEMKKHDSLHKFALLKLFHKESNSNIRESFVRDVHRIAISAPLYNFYRHSKQVSDRAREE